MGNKSISTTPVAISVPFDNSSNGFTSTNVQDAIGEAKNSLTYSRVSFTSAVNTTSATFSVVSSLTLTPPEGTYLAIWSGSFGVTNGANGSGEIALFLNGSQVADSTRVAALNVALLLGVIGTATINPGGDSIITVITTPGSQAIDVRFRSVSGDNVRANRGNLILIRIA